MSLTTTPPSGTLPLFVTTYVKATVPPGSCSCAGVADVVTWIAANAGSTTVTLAVAVVLTAPTLPVTLGVLVVVPTTFVEQV